MADIFFFTDVDLLNAQTAEQAYGPVTSSDSLYNASKEQYRLTSVHASSSDSSAYAVCKGQLLVQQDAVNSLLVNIILKPEDQPSIDLPTIKYFIYRGILKSSLTDGTNVIDSGTTFTKAIIKNNNQTPQKVLGIDLIDINYLDSDPIDNAFYKPKTDFELWTVYGGWSIGKFKKEAFGFEIIFESMGFNPTLDLARKPINVLELVKLTGSPTQADLFEYKTKKEVILNYLDPCAFFGNFSESKIKTRKSTDDTDENGVHDFSKTSNDEIYRDVLEGGTQEAPKNIFLNKNVVYLDIRNDQNCSFNYTENFNNILKISFIDDDNQPIDEFDYYSDGWPILRLTSLPTGGNKTTIRISFPMNEHQTFTTCVLTGNREITLLEKIKHGKSKFQDLEIDLTTNYSANSLFLNFSNYNNDIPVSHYLKVKFIVTSANVDIDGSLDNFGFKKYFLDYLFQPSIMKIPFENDDSLKIKVYHEDSYINLLADFGIDYTSTLGIAKDSGNTILFCSLSKRRTKKRFKAQSPSYSITNATYNEEFFLKHLSNQDNTDILYSEYFSIENSEVQFVKEKKKVKLFTDHRNSIDFNTEFFTIVLCNTDFQIINNLAEVNFESIYPPFLAFDNITEAKTNDGYKYLCYELVLKGFNKNELQNIDLKLVNTGIKLFNYTINDLI